jgi:hypothetical protein
MPASIISRALPLRAIAPGLFVAALAGATFACAAAAAQEQAVEAGGKPQPPAADAAASDATPADAAKAAAAAVRERHARFAALMKNVKLVGSFTRDDDETATPRREEYVISGATKVGTGDVWLVTSRIRYGSVDVTVPVPVEVKWAGETPVITLDEVTIPGLGTFSSRVVLDRGRYAGTWTHDKVGGHMFGTIVATPPADAPAPAPSPRQDAAGGR